MSPELEAADLLIKSGEVTAAAQKIFTELS
jgi:hypothetical protein